jgi:hypothetical protein
MPDQFDLFTPQVASTPEPLPPGPTPATVQDAAVAARLDTCRTIAGIADRSPLPRSAEVAKSYRIEAATLQALRDRRDAAAAALARTRLEGQDDAEALKDLARCQRELALAIGAAS